MAEYYQRSLLTLVASRDDRLLPDLPLFDKHLVRLPYRDAASREQRGHFFVYRLESINREYQTAVQDSEILTRAW